MENLKSVTVNAFFLREAALRCAALPPTIQRIPYRSLAAAPRRCRPQSHGHERRHGMFIRHTCHSRKRELLLERAAGLRRAETGRD
jgi:hypothetical protein